MKTQNASHSVTLSCLAVLAAVACSACGGRVDDDVPAGCDPDGAAATPSPSGTGTSSDGTGAPGSSYAGAPGSNDGGTTSTSLPIAGLFTTGVDGSGAALPDDAVDPHYVLSSADPAYPGPSALAVAATPTGWIPNTTTSKWISVVANTSPGDSSYVYTYAYTTTFTLTGVDPTTATLSGTWACDDSCTMQLNGTQVASYAAPAWTAIQPFAIPAGSPFQAGTNTLTVVVDNSGGYGTGVQIAEISGTATSSVGGTGTMGGDGGATSTPNTTIIDPQWERTNEHFLAAFGPGPDLEYYPSNSYPLYNEDNAPAGAAFTWTSTETWNGPNGWGNGPIPGFIPDETWFYTYDRVGDGMTSTVYWFRANVDLGPKSALTSVTLSDKWHAGHITVNDGLIVFLNGARQQIMPCAPGGTPTYLSPSLGDDPSTGCPLDDVVYPTGPAFDGVSLPLSALQDGTNEIAVMYEEINGFGGLDHLVVTMTAAPAPSDD